MGTSYTNQQEEYKATDSVVVREVKECWRCRLGVTDDGKVVHYSGCGEGKRE